MRRKSWQNQQFSFRILVFLNAFSCCVALSWTAAAVASVCRACNEGWHIEEAAVTLSINSEILIPVSYIAAEAPLLLHSQRKTHAHTHICNTYTVSLNVGTNSPKTHHKRIFSASVFFIFFSLKFCFTSDNWNCTQRTGRKYFLLGAKSVESVYFKGFFPLDKRWHWKSEHQKGGLWPNCLPVGENDKD